MKMDLSVIEVVGDGSGLQGYLRGWSIYLYSCIILSIIRVAHGNDFRPFFVSFFLHFYCQEIQVGCKNEEKMTRKTSEKWPKIVTVSNPNMGKNLTSGMQFKHIRI